MDMVVQYYHNIQYYFYGPRNCVTNLARPGIMCPFHESSRRSDGSVLDDGKDITDAPKPETQKEKRNQAGIIKEVH